MNKQGNTSLFPPILTSSIQDTYSIHCISYCEIGPIHQVREYFGCHNHEGVYYSSRTVQMSPRAGGIYSLCQVTDQGSSQTDRQPASQTSLNVITRVPLVPLAPPPPPLPLHLCSQDPPVCCADWGKKGKKEKKQTAVYSENTVK